MNFLFDQEIATQYHSTSQKIRVMSENWVENNIFCPCCGNLQILRLANNKPVADFQCENCNSIFELKSKQGKFGKKIVDGAYSTMIKRIASIQNPNLFLLNYLEDFSVVNMLFIPKFFFVPSIIEKRKPLAKTASRAGWLVGCNILLDKIPSQGKITIIENQCTAKIDKVVKEYLNVKKLQIDNIENRGWLFDVLNCINNIFTKEFTFKDVYEYIEVLQQKHIENHNIEAKIRQQLQVLRDKGVIEFITRGYYRKIEY